MLPPAARHIHILPELVGQSLISIGQLCDAGCDVNLTASAITVYFQNRIVLTGKRTPTTRLWQFDLPSTSTRIGHAMAAIGSATPAQLVAFAHAALFSPALSTLEKALKRGFLTNFPGLTSKLLRKHPPQSYAMAKGHLDQTRQNQRSTKPKPPKPSAPKVDPPVSEPTIVPPDDETMDDEDFHPASPTDGARTYHCYVAVMQTTGQVYTDPTGRFIVPSSTGNNYLLVLYDYDSNAILVAPMKTRTAGSIVAAYKTLHKRLCDAGLRPLLQRLDNECSAALKNFMREEDIDYQLAPPGIHRRNAAERAIRTFKNHFIAALCSVDKDFPLHLWDKLLPQAEITLNLLRASRINPKLSAWAQLFGTFDFNRTPLAPPGIRVIAHEKPADRTTWSPHGDDGWYVGPALESYRCFTIWMWTTRRERICDTVSWFPTKVTMPLASSTDLVMAGIKDIVHALQNPTANSPLAPRTDSQVKALLDLTQLLTNIASDTDDVSVLDVPAPKVAAPPTAPVLRVQIPTKPAPTPPIVTPTAPSLRVVAPPTSTIVPTPTAPTPPTVPDVVPEATYDNSTGAAGKNRRRRSRKAAAKAKTAHANAVKGSPITKEALDDIANQTYFALHGTAINPDTGRIAEYQELAQCSDGAHWSNSMADEFGRLCQGRGKDSHMPTGTNTMFFVNVKDIPKDRVITYARIVCADRPEKDEPRRVRMTVGGDRIIYPGETSTKTADITTVKCLLNSTISTPGARFLTMDLKDFYLGTPMSRYEYMRIRVADIPVEIMNEYNLWPQVYKGYVYVEIRRGMYGLPQAGRIANDQLIKFMEPHGYYPAPITPGLWKHKSRDTVFALVVDDFGVKYTSQDDAQHLIDTIKTVGYQVAVDWTGFVLWPYHQLGLY